MVAVSNIATIKAVRLNIGPRLSHDLVRRLYVLKFSYMAMLLFVICGSFWLEIVLKVGVLRRIKRTFLSVAPISLMFLIWDAYAIKQGHWFFDPEQTLGIYGPFDIPLEEYLFFIIIPLAALMTIEAVTTVNKHWKQRYDV
jgi:lycopene cyclase domain-containing protein